MTNHEWVERKFGCQRILYVVIFKDIFRITKKEDLIYQEWNFSIVTMYIQRSGFRYGVLDQHESDISM